METAIDISSELSSNTENKPKFLTAIEVSELFFHGKIKYARILKMTRDGEIPAMKQGKSYIYLWSALEAWAEKTLNKPNWAHKKNSRKK